MKRSAAASLSAKTLELSVAAPQVIAHRLLRMARPGEWPSAAHQLELFGMVSEKLVAFNQSWSAMYLQALSQQGRFVQQMLAGAWGGPAGVMRAIQRSSADATDNITQVLNSGLAPVHAKARSNARRLSRLR